MLDLSEKRIEELLAKKRFTDDEFEEFLEIFRELMKYADAETLAKVQAKCQELVPVALANLREIMMRNDLTTPEDLKAHADAKKWLDEFRKMQQ